ncbi:MAG: hypothetical protein KBT28_06940 [Bacteroidales bacterium]|nr:hypothetical protein [Candidatus Colimorpha merdihippi]
MHPFYDKMLQRIQTENVRFSISFERRRLTIDGKIVPIPTDEFLDWSIDEIIDELKYLFAGYHRSVPSERTEHKRRTYFYALPLSQLSDDDIETGLLREQAQFAIELFFLLNIANGKFTDFPFRDDQAFFWQPIPNHPLIVMRSWLTPSPQPATAPTTHLR